MFSILSKTGVNMQKVLLAVILSVGFYAQAVEFNVVCADTNQQASRPLVIKIIRDITQKSSVHNFYSGFKPKTDSQLVGENLIDGDGDIIRVITSVKKINFEAPLLTFDARPFGFLSVNAETGAGRYRGLADRAYDNYPVQCEFK
jgi:hypothetical protein